MIGADPRKAALFILNELEKGYSNLDLLINNNEAALFSGMPLRDRGLANALIYGVLRWRGRLDWHISQLASRKVKKIKPAVLNILRLGLFQILFMDRIPESAAVNTSVELAKKSGQLRAAGFVNAILRRAARSANSLPCPDPHEDPVQYLAVCRSFPGWLAERWKKRFGAETADRLCGLLNEIPPVTVRVNTIKTDRDRLFDKLADEAERAEKTRISPWGIALFGLKRPVHLMEGFKEGLFQVQDESAQLASLMLAPRPGENVFDACAGMGGKTGHMAQLMDNSGRLVAADSDGRKLEILEGEMKRLGVEIVETTRCDLENTVPEKNRGIFDRVLVDAPCSGLGVIRRNPDIKWSARPEDFERLSRRQAGILQGAAVLVRPGGILVYAVCSMEPEETDAVAERFLKARPDFITLPAGQKQTDPQCGGAETGEFLRLVPHVDSTDGFFIARFQRIGKQAEKKAT